MNRIWDSDETCEAVASIYSWRPSPLQTTAEAITKCIENSISSSSNYIFNQPLDHNFPDPLICNSRALIYQNIKIHSGICTNTYIYIYLAIYKYIYIYISAIWFGFVNLRSASCRGRRWRWTDRGRYNERPCKSMRKTSLPMFTHKPKSLTKI